MSPHPGKSILVSLLLFVVWFLLVTVCAFVLGLTITILSDIPVLGIFVQWLFMLRGGSGGGIAVFICALSFLFLAPAITGKLKLDSATAGRAMVLCSIYIFIYQGIMFFVNLFGDGYVGLNEVCLLLNGFFFALGKDTENKAKSN